MEQIIKFLALCKTIVISLVVWTSILPWLPFFFIYRNTIDFILRIKHGKKYGGLFDLHDGFFFLPDVSKCSMTMILYVRSDSEINLFEVIRKVFQEKVFSDPSTYPKLTSSKHDFGGYPYFVKNGVAIDDTIKSLQLPEDRVLTEEYLKEVTGELSMKKYPRNESVLWEIYISEESIDNKHDSTCYQYPVIVRVHHGICDGTSLIALLIRLFGDESSQNYGEELFKKLFNGTSSEKNKTSTREAIKMSLIRVMKAVRLWLDLIFLAIGRTIEENQLRASDQNALHKLPCSGEKIVAWAVEEYVECIPLIKKIRRETNSKFMSVVCTAVSASMSNYFKRNSYPIPDYTSGGLAQVLDFPDIDPSKPVKLKNKATACMVQFPTYKKLNTMIETLKKTDEIMKQETKYSDGLVSHAFVALVFGIIPVKLLSWSVGLNNHTFVLSNIPGGSQLGIFEGCAIQKVIGLAPNLRGIGISFTLLSYDNRLQIGIMVDKVLTESQKEVQQIADDILYYIKIMDAEVRKVHGE